MGGKKKIFGKAAFKILAKKNLSDHHSSYVFQNWHGCEYGPDRALQMTKETPCTPLPVCIYASFESWRGTLYR